MDEMKGCSQTVLFFDTGRHRVELAVYADESWVIRKDGRTLSTWEPHEQDDCFRTFAMLTRTADNEAAVRARTAPTVPAAQPPKFPTHTHHAYPGVN
jgi:hypothetical protein